MALKNQSVGVCWACLQVSARKGTCTMPWRHWLWNPRDLRLDTSFTFTSGDLGASLKKLFKRWLIIETFRYTLEKRPIKWTLVLSITHSHFVIFLLIPQHFACVFWSIFKHIYTSLLTFVPSIQRWTSELTSELTLWMLKHLASNLGYASSFSFFEMGNSI